MAIGINRVCLLGNLTRDPEIAYTKGENPQAVCGLRVAVNGREKRGGVWEDRADYFDVRVWGNRGESCATHLHKGSQVCVDGRLRNEEWDDKDTGQKRYRTLIVADNVQFIGKRGEGGGQPSAAFVPGEDVDFGAETGAGADFATPTTDDDIPF